MKKNISTPVSDRPVSGIAPERLFHRLADRPALMGRDMECSFLHDYMDAARDGQGRFILISGRAGTGKTRLIQEVINTPDRQRKGNFLIGICSFHKRGTPYYPLRQIMSSQVNSDQQSEALEGIPFFGGGSLCQCPWDVELEPDEFVAEEAYNRQSMMRQKLFYDMCHCLLNIAADHPLFIILEDIQWADISSIRFLHFLARNISESKILIIGTYDPEDPFSTGHGLDTILRQIAREMFLETLEPQSITGKESRRLVEWYFPRNHFSDSFFESAHTISQGNPYLLRTVLELLLDEGIIETSQGSWSNTTAIEHYSREPILSMVRKRLRSIDDPMRSILEYAASIGGHLIPEVLSPAMGVSLPALQQAFIDLEKNHRLLRVIEGEYVLEHPLIGQAVYSGMEVEHRRLVHQRIAETLEQIYDGQIDFHIYELAHHYAQSGQREKALYYLEQATDEARQSLAFQEALRFCTMGLSKMGNPRQPVQDNERRKMRLLLLAGEMNQVLGQWEASMEQYQNALSLAEDLRDEKIRGDAFMQIGLAYAKRGMWTEAESFYGKSIRILEETGAKKQLGLVKTYDADIKLGRCELKRAQTLYEEALNMAMRTMNQRLMARIYNSLGVIADIRGDLMGAMVNYSKSLNLYKGLEEYLGMADVYRQLGNMHASGQKWEQALEFYDKCIGLYTKVGEVGLLSLAYLNKALATLNLLAVGKAEKLCDTAQRYLLQVEDQRGMAECNKMYGLIASKKSEWHYAQRRFEDSIRILESCGDSLGLAQNLSEIGDVYALHGKDQMALELFQRAYDLYKQLDITNRSEELRIRIKSISSPGEDSTFKKKRPSA